MAALGLLVLLAAGLRLGVALATVDIPGDGPSRAALGYQCLASPRLVRDGHWLPLGEVLVGLANLLVPDPLWAARALALVTGTASVRLLAQMTAVLWGPAAGLAAGALLALLPMHVAASATALIDVPALFFLLLGLLAVRALARTARPVGPLLGLALASALATGTRYEGWILLAVAPLHQLTAGAGVGRAALALLAVLPVPTFWTVGALGGPSGLLAALAFVQESAAAVGGTAVPLAPAVRLAGERLVAILGPATATLAVAGLLAPRAVADRAARAGSLTGILALSITCGALVELARGRGESFVDRYALPAAVLLLPFAVGALAPALGSIRRGGALVLALAGSTGLATWLAPPQLYLQRRIPDEVVELARFLDRERPPGAAILFTRAGWLPTYVPLLHRLGRDEYRIVSWYLPDPALRAFLARARPALLVTRSGDEPFVERIRAAGAEPGAPTVRFGRLEVRPLALPEAAGGS